ncbi:hypothetical protein SNOG_14671 [Parastagonospora nodorum SN15]|uniref:Major facilitator superfamily (MFS) profile domain-containing protein n=1 Tax=Phaeosphaeria nodorum (strain SN15 / ATCC MYA-4574 / FGSC 10173) TaxID=321614 RepID=Q0U0F2_PHANO|nr:hypothetical protein SNOG_14671 [Parastagonospora nodorum SN15]EAT77863.1 hypothetical protein SNOG_14671 [Parastagonospora nodorum SN15]
MADHAQEKEVYNDPNTVHNEKMVSPGDEKLAIHDSDSGSGDANARRQSVAGNIVHNPLQRLSKGSAAEQASAFAEGFGMPEHSSLFARAALVARDPERFEMLTELEQDERDALIYERDHKWHGPKMLWYSIGLCAVGAATQGWDQTGSNGANLSFHEEFNITGKGRDEWIVGIINAIIFLTAGLIGAFIVDPLNKYLGRRGEIFFTAIILTVTPIGSACAQSWQGLFAARFIMGIGIGAKNATVPIYSAEMDPARIRGALVMSGSSGSARVTSQRLWDCFSIPRIRRANYGASTVMLAQQMCGINIISFYSSTIFVNAGYTPTQALYASLGYGALQVVFTIPTLFLIDTKGRRTLCLITFPIMCIMLLAAGLSLLVPADASTGARLGPVVLFVYLFTIAYSLGEGPVAFQYSAEVFPTIQREQGMAWAVCINNTFAGILGLTFPRMTTVMTPTGAFGFYAGLNLIAWGMIFCFVRETKQLTLEELDQVFNVPTSVFLKYEIKRNILRQRVPKPELLDNATHRVEQVPAA